MHDFKAFPELTNNQMQLYYFDSPHKQIFENFRGRVIRVIDGDTIRITHPERDFDFPLRLANVAAAEIKEGGVESKIWLESKILKKDVDVVINQRNRVGKWGRIIGTIWSDGININEQSINERQSIEFGKEEFDFNEILERHKI
tara:strand:+ start:6552 stop:6983 length:432 start_codon:yes stop_codon:yes gene_type:complete